MHSLRERVIDLYRRLFDRLLASPEARAELGEPDPVLVVAQLLGPLLFLWLTGLRPVTPADCEHIMDDFLAATVSDEPGTSVGRRLVARSQ